MLRNLFKFLKAAIFAVELQRTMVCRTRDIAFTYRMPAGFAGDVNRTHPFSVEPCQQNALAPVALYGVAVVADTAGATNTVRGFVAGDTAITIPYGISVRPFPIQQATTGNQYGGVAIGVGGSAAVPPTAQPLDVLRKGYAIVQLNVIAAPTTKGSAVYVWCAATSGVHIQGGFEQVASGGNTAAMAGNITYNGPPDANGLVEICIN